MLAHDIKEEDFPNLNYPLYVSKKWDGIRCLTNSKGEALSKSLKPIRNKFIRRVIESWNIPFLDGELITLDEQGRVQTFNRVLSDVNSFEGCPHFHYLLFDHTNFGNFNYRLKVLQKIVSKTDYKHLFLIPQVLVRDEKELKQFIKIQKENELWSTPAEGIILRSPTSPYREGRCTWNEGYLFKHKFFEEGEAEVVGFKQFLRNENLPEINELGYQKRSKHQENLIPEEKLGALIVSYRGEVFSLGSGYTEFERRMFWKKREELQGKLVRFRFLVAGQKDKPRNPIYLGFREPWDM